MGYIYNSNTTLVKVKCHYLGSFFIVLINSNTTLVKVKYMLGKKSTWPARIQIQHLLKLNVITLAKQICGAIIQIQHLLKLNI